MTTLRLHALRLFALLLLALPLPVRAQTPASDRPRVRTITAFIRIDHDHYAAQIEDALLLLRQARTAYQAAGYTVQTIRIVTQPFPEYTKGLSHDQALAFLQALDTIAAREAVLLNVGPAMMRDSDDPSNVDLLAEALATSRSTNGSLIMAGDEGIHWNAVRAAARLVKYEQEHSAHGQGNFNFAATAMLQPYAPFYPGAYHLGAGHHFAVGLESANMVARVFASTGYKPEAAEQALVAALTTHARAIEAVAMKLSRQTSWTYLGMDPTPAPLGDDASIGAAIENFLGARFGSSGTLTAASVITRAIKSVPVTQVGYSGLMLPVLEDKRLAQRWSEGAYHMDSLLSYSAVCATGLDTVPLPGNVSLEQLERILGDVAAMAFKWHKPLTARLLPVPGKSAGERSEFDSPLLTNVTLQPLP